MKSNEPDFSIFSVNSQIGLQACTSLYAVCFLFYLVALCVLEEHSLIALCFAYFVVYFKLQCIELWLHM